jgi:heme-degrading monooxygenase HmoA
LANSGAGGQIVHDPVARILAGLIFIVLGGIAPSPLDRGSRCSLRPVTANGRRHEEKERPRSMILELAILNVRQGCAAEFEQAFHEAQRIISSMGGYVSHELQRCLEVENKYVLLVRWQRLTDHTEGFRKSNEYQEWRRLLHHFYDPFPTVEHYEFVDRRDV